MTQENTTLEIEAIVTSTANETDYGVPNSPSWYEYNDYEVDDVSILGHTYTYSELVTVMGEQGANWLCERIIEGVTG